MSDAGEREIAKKLDILIRLISIGLCGEKTQKEKIEILAAAGLQPKEISEILGTTPNTVSVALSALRKNRRTSPRSKKTGENS